MSFEYMRGTVCVRRCSLIPPHYLYEKNNKVIRNMASMIDKIIEWLNHLFCRTDQKKPISKRDWLAKEKRCAYCQEPNAKYAEKSPDGPDEYFCSVDHYRKFVSESWAQGVTWRSLGLMEVETRKFVQGSIIFPEAYKVKLESDMKKDIEAISFAIGMIKPKEEEIVLEQLSKEKPWMKFKRYPVKCRVCGKHTRTTDKETAEMAKTKNNFTCWTCAARKKK